MSPLRCLGLALVPVLAGCASEPPRPESKPHPRGALWRWQQRVGPDGTLPPGAVVRAARQRAALSTLDGAVPPVQWTWLGPGNIGGRLRAILIHPIDPRIMWVGAASGGVWKTTDAGASWQPMNAFLAVLGIGSMALDPTDPDRLYVGTGEGFFDSQPGTSNLAAVQGDGIFVSGDGGQSWSQLPATAGWAFTNRIAIAADDPTLLLAATDRGIRRSTDQGATWQLVHPTNALDVRFHPTDSSEAVAGTGNGEALWSSDGGVTWSLAQGITRARRVELTYWQGDPSVVYAAVNDATQNVAVWRSDDGGRTYRKRTSGQGRSAWSRYTGAIWVDPTDDRRLIVGGVRVYRSTDGGVTLREEVNGGYYDYHVLVQHPNFDGTSNRVVFSGSDGGIHRTDDVAAGSLFWRELNNGLGVNQFYGVAVHPDLGTIMGGTQDQGTLRHNGAINTWTKTAGGDGGFAASDPTDPNLFYGEYQWLQIWRSTDGGRTGGFQITGNISESSPNFIAPFVLDPNDPRRMFAAGARLWRSNDVRRTFPSWTSIKPALSCGGESGSGGGPAHFSVDPPCNVSAIAVTPGNSDAVWVGHNNGQIWTTSDALSPSPSWSRVDAAVPDRWVSRIEVDPRDPQRVYVALMGYVSDNVWLTEDGGQTWRSISGSGSGALPDLPVPGLAVHPTVPGLVFVGTDLGVFATEDDGASWQVVSGGPDNVPVEQLVWRAPRQLVAATHGQGIFTADLPAASVAAVGTGCGAGSPSLSATRPVLGRIQAYAATGLAPNAPVRLLLGVGPASPTPIGTCTLQVPLPAVDLPAGSTDGQGRWSLEVAIPGDLSALGTTVTAQVAAAVSGGPALGIAELTGGVEMTLGF